LIVTKPPGWALTEDTKKAPRDLSPRALGAGC